MCPNYLAISSLEGFVKSVLGNQPRAKFLKEPQILTRNFNSQLPIILVEQFRFRIAENRAQSRICKQYLPVKIFQSDADRCLHDQAFEPLLVVSLDRFYRSPFQGGSKYIG